MLWASIHNYIQQSTTYYAALIRAASASLSHLDTKTLKRKQSPYPTSPLPSARVENHALVLPALDILERLVEVLPAALDGSRLLLVAVQVGVDKLDEPIDILGRHLTRWLACIQRAGHGGKTY